MSSNPPPHRRESGVLGCGAFRRRVQLRGVAVKRLSHLFILKNYNSMDKPGGSAAKEAGDSVSEVRPINQEAKTRTARNHSSIDNLSSVSGDFDGYSRESISLRYYAFADHPQF
jgi:hypothetical protein